MRSSLCHGVAIVGGGVIGLGIGWRLASAGCRVEIFDQGGGASHAAAGMLAPAVEAEPGETALLALNRLSLSLWPAFAAALEAASGQPVDLRTEGTLVVAPTADDAARLRHALAFQQRLGLDTRWLAPAEVLAREPRLHPGLAGALYSPGDHQVDNRKLLQALRLAATAAGVVIHQGRPVTGLVITDARIRGLRLGTDTIAADCVVLAAGAWSRGIDGLPAPARPPVRPVKGQMLCLRMDPGQPLLSHVVWSPGGTYLVPRRDGRLIIGATTEEKGFDLTLTAGGVLALLDGAWRLLPGIEELPIDEIWAGSRPGSRDDAPILGPAPGVEGLILATGHHRNGILLTPVTADTISRLILTGDTDPMLLPFAPGRFTRT